MSLKVHAFSQNLDLIVNLKGDSIACRIDSIVDLKMFVQIKTHHAKKWIQTIYNLDQMQSYQYNCIGEWEYVYKPGTSVITDRNPIENSRKYARYYSRYYSKVYLSGDHFETRTYNSTLAGMLAVVPGLGHLYINEPFRGIVFIAGIGASLVSLGAFAVGIAWGSTMSALPFGIIGAGGLVTLYIWNISDARKIAGIKNLVGKHKTLNVNISPKIEMKNAFVPTENYGISMKLSF